MADLTKFHSGSNNKFDTGAHREVKDGKGRYDLIPASAIRAWARRMEDGAKVYGDRNWEKGMPTHTFMDSLLRHAFQVLEGDDSEDHLAAILFNTGAIIFIREQIQKGILPKELDTL